MTDQWIGCTVTVDCGDILGFYKGTVVRVDTEKQSVILQDATRNGIKCHLPEVTICAQDICDLKILKHPKDSSEDEDEKQNYANAVDNLKNLTLHSSKDDNAKRKDSKKKVSTPRKVENRRYMTERDEACFSASVDSILDKDFDFEKNLALFDKQAVFEQINALSKSEVTRLVDCNRKPQPKYRCDENVLNSGPAVLRQIIVPCEVETEYVTDTGLLVPSITLELHNKIVSDAESSGLTQHHQIEMFGRGASEMVLQLLGGCHRLNPQNSHQRPTVVILCGSHVQGTQVICCGRHLSNHEVNVMLLSEPGNFQESDLYRKELNLFHLSEGNHTTSISDLYSTTVDIIISGIDNHSGRKVDPTWAAEIRKWVGQCKAPTLVIDPPAEHSTIIPKWILMPILPLATPHSDSGLYLCDLGIPKTVFKNVGIKYSSPFGSKFVIPLHKKME